MKIEIETNGKGDETKILINGVEETKLKSFEFSVNVDRSNKAKMTLMKIIDGKYLPLSYFADDFKKFDEAQEIEKGENKNVIGGSKNK